MKKWTSDITTENQQIHTVENVRAPALLGQKRISYPKTDNNTTILWKKCRIENLKNNITIPVPVHKKIY